MRIVRHDPPEPGSIQPLELVRLNRIPNTLYFGSSKGDQIGITVHETDPVAIGDNRDDVPGKQLPVSTRRLAPCRTWPKARA